MDLDSTADAEQSSEEPGAVAADSVEPTRHAESSERQAPAQEAGATDLPASDSAVAAAAQPALLKLHAALKDLDRALFQARRALDVALDRAPESDPPPNLPYRELRRLAEHLRKSSGSSTDEPARARISELLAPSDDEEADGKRTRTSIVGVAPSGKIRAD